MIFKSIFLFINILYLISVSADEESCHSYAGGSVYPLGTGADHKLQWTQAVSKFKRRLNFCLKLIYHKFIKFLSQHQYGKVLQWLITSLSN